MYCILKSVLEYMSHPYRHYSGITRKKRYYVTTIPFVVALISLYSPVPALFTAATLMEYTVAGINLVKVTSVLALPKTLS